MGWGSLHLKRCGLGDTQEDLALVPELGETSLGSFSFGFESLGDASDLGLHTSVDNDDSCTTFGDLGSREDQTDSVSGCQQMSYRRRDGLYSPDGTILLGNRLLLLGDW